MAAYVSRIFCVNRESAVLRATGHWLLARRRLGTVRAAEPPPGPLGWAWCPGHRLGAATRPSGVDLLQIIYIFF